MNAYVRQKLEPNCERLVYLYVLYYMLENATESTTLLETKRGGGEENQISTDTLRQEK